MKALRKRAGEVRLVLALAVLAGPAVAARAQPIRATLAPQEAAARRGEPDGKAAATVTGKDGSQWVGEIEARQWTIDTAMGSISVELGDVLSTDLRETRLRDGSVLKGRVQAGTILLRTRFGEVKISPANVMKISFSAGPGEDERRESPAQRARLEPEDRRAAFAAPAAAPLGGKLGLGVDVSLINMGVGPAVRYWITNRIAGQAGYIALGGFTGYSVRGLYAFNKEVGVPGGSLRPYVGAGYMSASEKKSEDLGFTKVEGEVKGSGPAFFAGLHGNLSGVSPNLYYTGELLYADLTLTGTASAQGIYGYRVQVSENFSSITIGFSMLYYFSTPPLFGR